MKVSNNKILNSVPVSLKKNIIHTCTILNREGFSAYIVGGAIRDLILGRDTKDFDFATDARPDDIIRIFNRTIPTGIKHGTVTVLMNSDTFEITTFRSDGVYSDARHPDSIKFSDTIDEDLLRRDFTINGLAYDPLEEVLIDNHNGLEDISGKIIRTIGNPLDRFREDGLRTIRACRFSTALEFDIENETFKAMNDRTIHDRVKMVAVERFSDELFKGFSFLKISRMIKLLDETNLIRLFISDYNPGILNHEDYEILDSLEGSSETFKLAYWWRLAALSDRAKNISSKLKLSGKNIRDIEFYIKIIDFDLWDNDYELRKFVSSIKEVYREHSIEFLKSINNSKLMNKKSDILIDVIKTTPLIVSDLEINGADMISAGLSGKDIGNCFTEILNQVWNDPQFNNRDRLLEYIKKRR